MAVLFIPEQTGQTFIIGGQSSVGPFPNYSISKDLTTAGDGTTLNTKYTITISGQFIVDSDIDIGTSGARQSNYNQKIIQRLSAMRQYYNSYGRLEISPYGGQPNKLIWNDAKLLNVSHPDSPEESSSILYSDFVFTFEAYTEVSILGTPDGNFSIAIDEFDYDKFFVSSVSESWDMTIDDDVTMIEGSGFIGPKKTYTITHSVSATGLRKPLPAGGFDTSAWKEAQRWVRSRLVDSPADMQITDVMGGNNFTEFAAKFFGDVTTETSTDLSTCSFYNHTRVPQVSISDGSYSVTETWKAGTDSASTVDLNIDLDIDENQIVSVTASGSIQGLDSLSLNNIDINKNINAENTLIYITDVLYDLCKLSYDQLGTGDTLPNVVKSRSIGRNIGAGVITFSYKYDDKSILLDNALSTDINISDDNKNHQVQLIAIIPIIAKTGGPVFQDMNTSRERKRSVQLEAVMKRGYRDSAPENGVSIALSYAPSILPHYIQSLVENYSPTTGSYSVSVEWSY